MRDNRDKDLNCEQWGYRGQARHCDIREQSFASRGRIAANAGRNGGVSVKGWLRNDVLVRSRVEAWADTDADASALASQIRIDTSSGAISASGPIDTGRRGWAVSFEIFVPRLSNMDLKAHNGGIDVSDVEGAIHLETTNGGVHLARDAGDVSGSTTNGGLSIVLTGKTWIGRQLELNTKNGGVTVLMPENYSAHLQAETIHGGMLSEFPVILRGGIRPRNLDATLGSGGPLIHVGTVNGGVSLKRS